VFSFASVGAARRLPSTLGSIVRHCDEQRRRARKSDAIAVGIAWFDREQLHLLREVAADQAKLDDALPCVSAEDG
jgi:hypothetical protein